jgi:hypothetical protein
MNINTLESLLISFRWNLLSRLYGCAHSSIIGFIATEWISQSEYNSILDGAPSPITVGRGERSGQKHADLILCKAYTPFIVVEVETLVSKYEEKIDKYYFPG